MPEKGSKEGVREFLLANIGKVVTTAQVQNAGGGAAQSSRRLRELREQEGWIIQSHLDNPDLKPGEYLLASAPPPRMDLRFTRTVSARLRAQVLDRNGSTCQMCGIGAGEVHPSTGRKVTMHVSHIQDKSLGGKDELSNLRTLCSVCNQGAKNVTTEKPTTIWLLSQVRRAGREEKWAVYEYLRSVFSTPEDDG